MEWSGKKGTFNEFIRKKIVYLKRNTKMIPFLFIIITCMVFTFKLSVHSEGAIRSDNGELSLFLFIVTLLSVMSIISFVTFKKFNLKGIIPFCITVLFLGVQVAMQFVFVNTLSNEVGIAALDNIPYLEASIKYAKTHLVFLFMSLFTLAILPLLIKFFNLINTALPEQFEETEEIEAIVDIADDDNG